MKKPTLFDEQFKLERISKLGDPLERLNACINWDLFVPILEAAFKKEPKGPGGRPAYSYLMMFKILLLQEYYGLSDEQMEFQITDRFSFMRFLGLRSCDKVPDRNTIWLFREQLSQGDVIKALFHCFHKELERNNMIVNKGKIVDATFVTTPRQRNSRDENDDLKEGSTPANWSEKKCSHKDTEASWTKKGNQTHFGYKNHIKVDAGSKFIDDYLVTTASANDGTAGTALVSDKENDQPMYGDSGYHVNAFKEALEQAGMIDRIHEKGYRNKKITTRQKKSNHRKSKIRARVEHVFGQIKQIRKHLLIRTIGIRRANLKVGLVNLLYNLTRYEYHVRVCRA